MLRPVIFKTLKTFGHKYVYDRHTNSVIKLSEHEYDELSKVEKGELPSKQSQVIRKYQEFGLFAPNTVKKIEHRASAIIEQYMNTRIKQLALQVTREYDSRCESRSGGIRSNQRMSVETAEKSICFFLERCYELANVTIGFYGGEPLLEFELIKQCVEYAKSCVEGKNITFHITTSGMLLSDEVADYLAENDFSLVINLIWPKKEWGSSFGFANDTGFFDTFDTVMENIKRVRARHPELDKKTLFMTAANPYKDSGCTPDYLSTEEVFGNKQTIFGSINEAGADGEISRDERCFRAHSYEYIKLLLSLTGKLDSKYTSPIAVRLREAVRKKQWYTCNHSEPLSSMHNKRPCLHGAGCLFVRTDGAFFPCEHVNHELDYLKIGTLEAGFDARKINEILSIGSVTQSECRTCWNLRHCSLCAGQIEFDTEPSKNLKLAQCAKNEASAFFDIYESCVLHEFGFNPEAGAIE